MSNNPNSENVLKQAVFNKARKDKFLLILTLPKILRNINSEILSERSQSLLKQEALQFSIYGSPIPQTSVPEQSLPTMGQTYNVTSQVREKFDPISVNFTVDNRFSNWWVLWKWLEVLNNPRESWMPDQFAEWEDGNKTKDSYQGARDVSDKIREKLIKRQNKNHLPNISSGIEKQPINMVNNFLDYQTIITILAKDEYNVDIAKFNFYNSFITQLAGIEYNYRDPGEMESTFTFVFNQMEVELIGPAF